MQSDWLIFLKFLLIYTCNSRKRGVTFPFGKNEMAMQADADIYDVSMNQGKLETAISVGWGDGS